MRLISLAANSPGFHTVNFNRSGPSFIIGKQAKPSPDQTKDTDTYNGVGKSLLIYLVNYCLGADVRPSFVERLDTWEFTLTVELEMRETKIIRRVSQNDEIQLGFERLSVKEFRSKMQGLLFPGTEDVKFLTHRSLMGLFLRPGKTAYNSFDSIHMSEKPVQKLVRTAYLLGLDLKLVLRKYELQDELQKGKEMSTRFEKDPIIKEYFQEKRDVNLDISDLQDQLSTLEKHLSEFKVAENYHEIEKRAEALKRELQKLRNDALTFQTKLKQIDESLVMTQDISLADLRSVYEASRVLLPGSIVRTLDEVESFHSELLRKRKTRLRKERQVFEQKLLSVESRIAAANEELDGNLRHLNEYGALGELLSLKDRANETKARLQKLQDYRNLTKQYKDLVAQTQFKLAEENLEATRYIDSNQDLIANIGEKFRAVSKRLYPDKSSGLTVENDPGENQTRFKIDAKILSDSSDGINEAKIFAFDVTVATLRKDHLVEFLFHDSRLFAEIDPRQRALIFQIASELSCSLDFQYIATANQDLLEPLRGRLGVEQYQKLIADNTILELTDDSPEDKLLGIEIDLDYA